MARFFSRPVSPTLLFPCAWAVVGLVSMLAWANEPPPPIPSPEAPACSPEDGLDRYRADVLSIHDSTVINVDLHLGLGLVIRNEPIHLHNVDPSKLRGAKEWLKLYIHKRSVVVQTIGGEKPGRLVAIVWLKEYDGTWTNMNEALVRAGY